MTQQQEQARPARPQPTFRNVEVSKVEHLTPHMVRVTFTGEELEGYASRGPAEHIKVFFPAPGQEKPIMPEWGPDGPIFTAERPISRTYTPRKFDPVARELIVDFLVHGEGPGSSWAREAAPGKKAVVAGPGGPYVIDESVRDFLIAGDESALPGIGTLLEKLPSDARVRVLAEVSGPGEEISLTDNAAVSVTWLYRDAAQEPGRLLEATIRELEIGADVRVWVGCEAGVMRDIRKHLIFDRGMDRSAMHTHGYWKQGAENHPDHDVGQDI